MPCSASSTVPHTSLPRPHAAGFPQAQAQSPFSRLASGDHVMQKVPDFTHWAQRSAQAVGVRQEPRPPEVYLLGCFGPQVTGYLTSGSCSNKGYFSSSGSSLERDSTRLMQWLHETKSSGCPSSLRFLGLPFMETRPAAANVSRTVSRAGNGRKGAFSSSCARQGENLSQRPLGIFSYISLARWGSHAHLWPITAKGMDRPGGCGAVAAGWICGSGP